MGVRPWDVARRRWPPAWRVPVPPRVDVALSAAFVALTVAEVLAGSPERPVVLHILVVGGAMALLAWRRSVPVLVALTTMAAHLTFNPEGEFSVLLSLVLVTFTVGAESDPPRSYVGLLVVLVPFVTLTSLEGFEPSDLAAALVFLVGPWSVGTTLRQRGRRATEAQERADRLERERETAVEAERTRIARELHDVVSHAISVVTIQTQAVRRRLPPELTREAADLAAVEATAREAMAEMRRLFGVLRTDGESLALSPQPGLAELDRLAATVRSSGLTVEVAVTGDPYELPPGADLAAYRIVQEGLTNALRHAGATRATVCLDYGPQALHIAVEDDGRGLPAGSDSRADGPGGGHGGGHGLLGVRERVLLYGGTLEVGRSSRGGVRLAASLPVREGA